MSSTRRRLGALLGTAVAAAAVLTVAFVALGPGVSEGAPTLTALDAGAPLAASSRSPDVSDDGTAVAFVGVVGGQPTAVAQRNGSPVTHPAVAGTVESGTAISADGCTVAYWSSTAADAQGTPPSSPTAPPGTATLYRWDVCQPGTLPAPLPVIGGLTSASALVRPALSADGSAIAYAARVDPASAWHIGVITGQTEHAVRSEGTSIDAVTTVDLSADGQTLAFDFAPGPAAAPAAIFVGPLDVAPASSIPVDDSTILGMPSLSADGKTVAFVANGRGAATVRPYVYSALTQTTTPVPVPQAGDPASAWSAVQPTITSDGSQIAYTLAERVGADLAVDATGAARVDTAWSTSGVFATGSRESLSAGTGTASTSPAISATGQVALFASGGAQSSDVWLAQRVPALTVTPAFDLGTVAVGSSSQPAAVTFTNASSVGIQLGAFAGVAAPFTVGPNTCEDVIVPPAGTCTVTVVFTPTAAVDSTATVTVGAQGVTATASLSGRGRSLARSISISPSAMSFPSTPVGSRGGPVGATVTNTGEVAVDVSAVSIGGSDGGQFVLTGNGCANTSLAPKATCAIEVTAIPSRPGSLRATVTVTGTQSESATATLTVTATSTTPTTPTTRVTPTTRATTTTAAVPGRLSASPSAVAFPATEVGSTSAAVEVTITNVGASTVSKLGVSLSDDTQFAVDAGSCGGANLAAGRTCTVAVAITPQEGGPPYGALTLTGSRGETVTVALTMGTAATTTIIVNPGVVQSGGTTTVIGTGFEPGIGVVVQLLAPNGSGPAITLSSTVAGADGNFRALVQIPRGLGQGGWRMQAMAGGEVTDSAAVLIQQATPQPGAPGGGGIVGGVVRPADGAPAGP